MGHPMPPGANPLANREKLLLKGGDGPLSGLAAIGGCQGGEGVQREPLLEWSSPQGVAIGDVAV